jgi:hypothetical protein
MHGSGRPSDVAMLGSARIRDCEVFASIVKRGKPVRLPVNRDAAEVK